jgi:hypothetical protein
VAHAEDAWSCAWLATKKQRIIETEKNKFRKRLKAIIRLPQAAIGFLYHGRVRNHADSNQAAEKLFGPPRAAAERSTNHTKIGQIECLLRACFV